MKREIPESDIRFPPLLRRPIDRPCASTDILWWTHWRELADYFLPRRYKWLITPNMMGRGSPINQHILDSSGCIFARNLASGLVSGKSSPTAAWFQLKIGHIDSTKTSPVSLWLAECERLLYLVFAESNFYNSIGVFYYDLVIFGTATMLIYEDFDNVINCINPCLGEYYIDIDGRVPADGLLSRIHHDH